MKTYPVLLSFFLVLLFLFSAGCSKENNDPPAARTIQDVEQDFQALSTSEGTHDVQLEFLNSTVWNFRIIAPKVLPGETKPLVIHLHGASGGDPDAHKATACYVEPGFENLDAFIISPNGGTKLWYDLSNQEQVINLTLLAKKYWPVDPDKIVVMGYSNGGNGSWFFGETQPTLYSAAIPVATAYSTIHTNGSVRVMPNPMYVIHGEQDELFPLAQTQDWVQKTIDAGSDVTFVVAPGLSHYAPCDYVPYIKDAVEWLKNDVWK
ncbi:MAG: dienelactone hydrolase family protein [Lewinellaceae bacterium]|nr:dienelactone hydrolase family protein [Saprospiraceae bacterium]MCB9314955.1 dienelactone hydrolase family protein [Lewinellaceae bacterium]MCB9329753.1 dienelactone hydrolase family protein [Lewinellaceae bacterium]